MATDQQNEGEGGRGGRGSENPIDRGRGNEGGKREAGMGVGCREPEEGGTEGRRDGGTEGLMELVRVSDSR